MIKSASWSFSIIASFVTRWLGLLIYSSSWIYRAPHIPLPCFFLILPTYNNLPQVLLRSCLPHPQLVLLILPTTRRISSLVDLREILRGLSLIGTLGVLSPSLISWASLGFWKLHLFDLKNFFFSFGSWLKVVGGGCTLSVLFDDVDLGFWGFRYFENFF